MELLEPRATRRRRAVRSGASFLAVALLATSALSACAPPPEQGQKFRVPADFGEGLMSAMRDLMGPPPGANLSGCVPSAEHPRPLILVHGFAANMADSLNGLAPFFANAGYCVYALNYGNNGSIFGGTQDIRWSALQQFGPFVDDVLSRTGADQVDVIGHSEGSIMPRWWMRFGPSTRPDGSSKVASFVGVGPASHGADLDGAAAMLRTTFPFQNIIESLSAGGCVACEQVLAGSTFLSQLNSGQPLEGENFTGIAQPGVRYLMLATEFDNFLVPYQYGFIDDPAVTNMTVQDVCPIDGADHLSIVFDPVAYDVIANFLDPATAKAPRCVNTQPVFAPTDQRGRAAVAIPR